MCTAFTEVFKDLQTTGTAIWLGKAESRFTF